MTKTTSQSPLQTQAEASVDAVAAEIQRTARQELDALRDLIGTRLASLEHALDRDRNDPAFVPILQKLCEVATEQADGASASARAQAEEAAARELAAAREQAQTDLNARASSTTPHRLRASSSFRSVSRNRKSPPPRPLARSPTPSAWPHQPGMMPRSEPPISRSARAHPGP